MKLVVVLLAGYALGSVPAGYLLVRALRGEDVRESGSGNIGATNVLRTTGRAAGIATLLLDAGKGALAVALAGWMIPGADALPGALATFAVIAGHSFPITLGFRGGKGVACAVGAALVHAPLAALVALAGLVVAVAALRWVSLGSLVFAIVYPAAVMMKDGDWVAAAPLVAASVLIVVRHVENIARIRAGTERRLGGG